MWSQEFTSLPCPLLIRLAISVIDINFMFIYKIILVYAVVKSFFCRGKRANVISILSGGSIPFY